MEQVLTILSSYYYQIFTSSLWSGDANAYIRSINNYVEGHKNDRTINTILQDFLNVYNKHYNTSLNYQQLIDIISRSIIPESLYAPVSGKYDIKKKSVYTYIRSLVARYRNLCSETIKYLANDRKYLARSFKDTAEEERVRYVSILYKRQGEVVQLEGKMPTKVDKAAYEILLSENTKLKERIRQLEQEIEELKKPASDETYIITEPEDLGSLYE